jgi:hypothetical protein
VAAEVVMAIAETAGRKSASSPSVLEQPNECEETDEKRRQNRCTAPPAFLICRTLPEKEGRCTLPWGR